MGCVVLGSGRLRVELAPDTGKITSLFDKARKKEWLWRCAPQKGGKCYDDAWSGGIDLLFPCDEPQPEHGAAYGDHGICWQANWRLMKMEKEAVALLLDNPVFRILYHVQVKDGELELEAVVTSKGEGPFPYLFRWHPAFALEKGMKLLLNAGYAVCDLGFHEPPPQEREFAWPVLRLEKKHVVSMAETDSYLEGQCGLQYLKLNDSSVKLADSTGRSLQLHFDQEELPYLALFYSNGGWRGHRVLVPEPATQGAPEGGKGWGRCLQGGETVRFGLKITV